MLWAAIRGNEWSDCENAALATQHLKSADGTQIIQLKRRLRDMAMEMKELENSEVWPGPPIGDSAVAIKTGRAEFSIIRGS
jgi:hypothetical protein